MTDIKRNLTQIAISVSEFDTKLIRYQQILKYKKDRDTVSQMRVDVQKLEDKINKLRVRAGTFDIYKQP